ncbi:MAG: hypothetical protein KA801_07460 [Syntrophorhabdaceae bacterium]|nr:hypothetical protein [Syntrophorhabdaceae bacterium]
MPLAFHSLSHGEVAFGFFNIDTDMMLLDVHFFFADDLSAAVGDMASGRDDGAARVRLNAYTLDAALIGNLMGAIRGIDLRGFIGEVYRRFPFPAEEEKFRQQPEGFQNRAIIEEIVKKYAGMRPIDILADGVRNTVDFGGYLFDREGFHALILYLWEGGYPRWRDNLRPAYVIEMKEAIRKSENRLFTGLSVRLEEP